MKESGHLTVVIGILMYKTGLRRKVRLHYRDLLRVLSPLDRHFLLHRNPLLLLPRRWGRMREPGGGGHEGGSAGAAPTASISFFFLLAFGWPMAYIPVAPDSFGATGCPRSRVLN